VKLRTIRKLNTLEIGDVCTNCPQSLTIYQSCLTLFLGRFNSSWYLHVEFRLQIQITARNQFGT